MRRVHRRGMSVRVCVSGSRLAKLHVLAARHMHADNSTWGKGRSLGSAVIDLASAVAQALGQGIVDPADACSVERPLHHKFVKDQSAPAEA